MSLPIINATGAWTGLGASTVPESTIDQIAAVLRRPVLIEELQAEAAAAARECFGVEDGLVSACAASAITAACAACLSLGSPLGIGQLPLVTGPRSKVLLQKGHACDFGAPISQVIRITGAEVIEVGAVNNCSEADIEGTLTNQLAAAVYVVSYETMLTGQVPLLRFIALCRARQIPVIVDMAGQFDFAPFLACGADLYAISVHKALRGATAGLLLGRADLIAEARRHEHGILRPMKVGKEGIAGAIAALRDWRLRHNEIAESWERAVVVLVESLSGISGVRATRYRYGGEITGVFCRVELALGAISNFPLCDVLKAAPFHIHARPDPSCTEAVLLCPLNLSREDLATIIAAIKRLCADINTKENHD